MKALLIIFLIIICKTGYSQDNQEVKSLKNIDIPFNTYTIKVSEYYKLLGIRDKSAIIVSGGRNSSFGGNNYKFLVFFKNGLVRKFTIDTSNDKVIEARLSTQQAETYKQFLNDCVNKWLDIDAGKLFQRERSIVVLDGPSDHFYIYQGNKKVAFNSYASDTYIENKYVGWAEKQKLKDLIERFILTFDK